MPIWMIWLTAFSMAVVGRSAVWNNDVFACSFLVWMIPCLRSLTRPVTYHADTDAAIVVTRRVGSFHCEAAALVNSAIAADAKTGNKSLTISWKSNFSWFIECFHSRFTDNRKNECNILVINQFVAILKNKKALQFRIEHVEHVSTRLEWRTFTFRQNNAMSCAWYIEYQQLYLRYIHGDGHVWIAEIQLNFTIMYIVWRQPFDKLTLVDTHL